MPDVSARSEAAELPQRVRWSRTLHAGAMLALPSVAVVLAAVEVASGTTALWEPVLAISFYVLTMLGITVGFHRLFAHCAFKAGRIVRGTLAILGSMAAQGPPLYWVSNHRRHHSHVERQGDPHSPHCCGLVPLRGFAGFWHAHVGWTFTHDLTSTPRFARDLLQDPVIGRINKHYYTCVLTGLVIVALVGAWITRSWSGAWQGVLWGGGVRLFLSYHLTSSINSVTHMFGYRTFDTPDDSRNNLWLGIATLGEAWHNNHHAAPRCASFAVRWFEIDLGGLVVQILSSCELVSDVHWTRRTLAYAPVEKPPSQPKAPASERAE